MGGRGSQSNLGRVKLADIPTLSDTQLKSYTQKAFKDFNEIDEELKRINSRRNYLQDKLKDINYWAKRDPKYLDRKDRTKQSIKDLTEQREKISPKHRKSEKKYNLARNEWFKRYPKNSFLD